MADVDKKDLNTSIERLYKFKEETKRQFERMDAFGLEIGKKTDGNGNVQRKQ